MSLIISSLIKSKFLASLPPQAANHSYFIGAFFALLISYAQRLLLWFKQFTFGVFEEQDRKCPTVFYNILLMHRKCS